MSRLSPVAAACALLGAFSINPAFADDVYYTGNSADLHTVPTGYGSISLTTGVLFPGTSATPVESNNSVIVDMAAGGTIPAFVFGGIGNGLNAVSGANTVNIIKGTVANDVTGGFAFSEATSIPANVIYAETVGNQVTIGSGVEARQVLGGYSTATHTANNTGAVNSFADSNKLALTGASITESVYGGKSMASGQGSGLVTGIAEDNEVNIGKGSVINDSVFGGSSQGDNSGSGNINLGSTANRVNVSSSTVMYDVQGGYAAGYASGVGDVNIASGNNTVTVSGSTVNHNVYGGFGFGRTFGTGKVNVHADNNVLTLAGATVNGDVYGGYVEGQSQQNNTMTTAINNTVNISGKTVFSTNSSIYGGFDNSAPEDYGPNKPDVLTGNTLNVSTSGINIKKVGNFENYNFYLPASTTNNTVMIQTTDGADLTGSTVAIKAIEPGVALNAGDTVYLLKTGGLTGNPALVNSANVSQGYSLQYDLTLAQNANDIYATVGGVSVNPKTRSFLEGRLAGLALVTQGADIVANQGMSSAITAAEQQEGRLTVFGTVSGGSSRYDTGSHIDLDGFGLMAGVAKKQDNLAGAVFVEGGWGSYDSHNNFASGSVHGDGNTHYYGIGLLGRATLKNGMYLDGSFRIGKTSTDYTGKDYLDAAGNQAHYKSKVTYVSAHAGVGYMMPLNPVTDLDVSAKYLWSRQGSDSITVGGDPVHFDAENSQRLRGMAKVLRKMSPEWTLTGGLGYEYEFDGKAKGTLYHMYSIDSPSLKGGSGIGEIGLEYKPQNNQRLSLEAKLAGYVGQREGVSGLVRLNYAF